MERPFLPVDIVGHLLDSVDTVELASGCILEVLQEVDYTHAGAVAACAVLPAFDLAVEDSLVYSGLLCSALKAFPYSLLAAFLNLEDTD